MPIAVVHDGYRGVYHRARIRACDRIEPRALHLRPSSGRSAWKPALRNFTDEIRMAPKADPQFKDFHDAVVSHFELENGTLRITFEFFNDEKQGYERLYLVFHDVRDSEMNDARSSTLKAVWDDGEVIDLTVTDKIAGTEKAASIVIAWDDYRNKARSTCLYRFSFKSFDVSDERTSGRRGS